MIKLIIFDLDGVLIDAKNIHYKALNNSLSLIDEKYVISIDDHINKFDGLKTYHKLEILTKQRGLPVGKYDFIWNEKQKMTLEEMKSIKPSQILRETFNKLSNDDYKIACCSNSIRKTVLKVLSKLDIIEYFDLIISNQDVLNSKPHPEMYWKAISSMQVLPEETLIIEDSPHGLLAAYRAGSNILRVLSPNDTKYNNIKNKIKEIENNTNMQIPKWQDDNLNILIPMAGAGSRFEKAGYTFPKPLIDINGVPMIQKVVNNLNFDAKHTFIVQKSHKEKYNLDSVLNLISKNCNIIDVDGITEGAACTTLLAKQFINNDNSLIIANSDQFIEWNVNEFMYKMKEQDVDGGILCFNSTHPKWSFVKTDEYGFVTEVAEKNPISNIATVGIYYWKKGSDYIKYAEQMIANNTRHNNEFYVCPVFNEAIADGKKIKIFNIEKMWGLGTPEDLSNFLKNE
jgi:HAD superfamily hydrolase (TIGR01509 family)